MFFRVRRAAPQEPGAAFGGETHPVRDAGEERQNGALERTAQDVAAVIAAPAEETGRAQQTGGERGLTFAFTFQAGSIIEEFVLVRAVRERVSRDGLGQHVDDRVGECLAQVAEKGNSEHRVADEAIADDEDTEWATVRPGHG